MRTVETFSRPTRALSTTHDTPQKQPRTQTRIQRATLATQTFRAPKLLRSNSADSAHGAHVEHNVPRTRTRPIHDTSRHARTAAPTPTKARYPAHREPLTASLIHAQATPPARTRSAHDSVSASCASCWLRRGSRGRCHRATEACHTRARRATEAGQKRPFRCSLVPPCTTAHTPESGAFSGALTLAPRPAMAARPRGSQYQARFLISTPLPASFKSSSPRSEPRK